RDRDFQPTIKYRLEVGERQRDRVTVNASRARHVNVRRELQFRRLRRWGRADVREVLTREIRFRRFGAEIVFGAALLHSDDATHRAAWVRREAAASKLLLSHGTGTR